MLAATKAACRCEALRAYTNAASVRFVAEEELRCLSPSLQSLGYEASDARIAGSRRVLRGALISQCHSGLLDQVRHAGLLC